MAVLWFFFFFSSFAKGKNSLYVAILNPPGGILLYLKQRKIDQPMYLDTVSGHSLLMVRGGSFLSRQ